MTAGEVTAQSMVVERRLSEMVCRRAFKRHRFVKSDRRSSRAIMDGVAPIRVEPLKRLGYTYRKGEAVRSSEEDMRLRFYCRGRQSADDDDARKEDCPDETVVPRIFAEIRDVLRQRSDPHQYSEKAYTCYQPNDRDTLPTYAYKLAWHRRQRLHTVHSEQQQETGVEQQGEGQCLEDEGNDSDSSACTLRDLPSIQVLMRDRQRHHHV